jgi:flavin reductase (DIM6/NTAB) family NADH-FMN oxidoreductase RutF
MDDATKEQFHAVVRSLDYPMIIVTTAADDERSGCLVGFHTQCSIDPPRFWVGISKKNHTYGVARRASHLALHFPGADQVELARLFGELTGDDLDKFEGTRWEEGPEGMPMLSDCPNWLVGRVLQQDDGGDHVWFMVEPVDANHGREAQQLGFQAVRDFHPGHDA